MLFPAFETGVPMKYDVFVSYRHVRPDADVARAVARLVEGYVVAGSVGGVVKRRGFRVFRDVEELASGELGVLIESALAESEFLVVVCSPRTVGSVWCMREVEFFSRVRGVDHVLAVVVEGDPGVVVGDVVGGDVLAVDVRAGVVRSEGFGGFEGCESGVVDRLVRQSVGVLRRDGIDRLMAGVVGVSLGDLRQRQRERRMRRIIAATASAGLVMTGIGVSVTGLWLRARSAERAAKEESAAVAMKLSSDAIASGDRVRGLLYAKEAWKKADPDSSSYETLKAKYYENLSEGAIYPAMTVLSKIDTSGADGMAKAMAVSPKGDFFLTGGENNNVTMWSVSTEKAVKTVDVGGKPIFIEKVNGRGEYVVVTNRGRAVILDARAKRLRSFSVKLGTSQIRIKSAGSFLYLPYTEGKATHIAAYDMVKGTVSFDREFAGIAWYDVRADGKEFAVCYEGGGAFRYDSKGNDKATIISREEDAAQLMESVKASGKLSYSKKGKLSYSTKGTMLLYYLETNFRRVDTSTGEILARRSKTAPGKQNAVAISNDGRWAFIVDDSLRLAARYDLSTEQMRSADFLIPQQSGERSDILLESGVLSSNDSLFMGITSDNSLIAWSPRSRRSFFVPLVGKTGALGAPILRAEISEGGSKVFALGKDGVVNVVDVRGTDRSYESTTLMLARSNNGRYVYGRNSIAGMVHEVGTVKESIALPPQNTSWIAVSNDGKVASATGKSGDRLVVSHNRRPIYSPSEKIGSEYRGDRPLAVFGKRDDVVYVTSAGKVVRYGATGKRETYAGRGGDVVSLRASADGSLLAVSRSDRRGEGSWRIYKTEGGKQVAEGEGEMLSIVGSGGKLRSTLAVSGDRIVRQDAEGNELSNVAMPSGVRSDGEVLFEGSSDGTQVVVPSTEGSYFVIDAQEGAVLQRISTNARGPKAIFSGRRIVYNVLGLGGLDVFKEKEMPSVDQLEKTADKVLGGRRLSERDKEELS